MAQPTHSNRSLLEEVRAHVGTISHPSLAIGLCLIVMAIVCAALVTSHLGQGTTEVTLERSDDSSAGEQGQADKAYVDVEGAVEHPALYVLDEGARVADAVSAAGGMTPQAASGALNLARVVQDGEQIYVPTIEETQARGQAGGGAISTSQTSSSKAGADRININTADVATLQQLPGVGEATASKIVSDRESNGPFKDIEDLKRVSGIGDAKFAQMKDHICV